MKECINCGYERQSKDDEQGLVPRTECPRCGAIYEKMEKLKDINTVGIHPDRSRRRDDKKLQDSQSAMKATKSRNILLSLIIIALCVSAGYYYYVNKQKEASKIAQVKVRIFTTAL